MAEYIDRKALDKSIRQRFDMLHVYPPIHFLNYVNSIPVADVVEVVRCKDCRFCMAFKDKSDSFYGFYGHCRIWIIRTISDYAALVDADGYCSYGERKEGQR